MQCMHIQIAICNHEQCVSEDEHYLHSNHGLIVLGWNQWELECNEGSQVPEFVSPALRYVDAVMLSCTQTTLTVTMHCSTLQAMSVP